MENISNSNRTVTLSFKTTQEEKTALQQIALEKGISRSELMASLVSGYKNHYDYIGKSSPKEEALVEQLKSKEKENRKLRLSLENAQNRIELEQQEKSKRVEELMAKTRSIFQLKEELKSTNSKFSNLQKLMAQNETLASQGNKNSEQLYLSLGSMVLTGLSLFFLPIVFRD